MSGEYFNVEDDGTKFHTDYASDKGPNSTGKEDNTESNEKLQDIEVQLVQAEDRCNTLKGQLDYMKNLYSSPQNKTQKIRKYSSVSAKRIDSSSGSSDSVANNPKIKLKTDNSSGTKAINKILCGITESVNRLSDLHNEIVDIPAKTSSESAHVTNIEIKPIKSKTANHIKAQYPRTGCNYVPRDDRVKSSKPVRRDSVLSGRNDLKRHSLSVLHQRKTKHNRHPVKNVVELYHNDEAKESDSDPSIHGRPKERSKTSRSYIERSDIPPLSLAFPQLPNMVQLQDAKGQKLNKFHMNGIATAHFPEHLHLKQAKELEIDVNQYQLPTIASRMKQVAKCYFNAYNFKAIPFCATASTTPSHNIGINLQQVMSMLKTKQPISGISPTLAHNIGLAAERMNSGPGSMMIASVSSRTCSTNIRSNACPLTKTRMNYYHLQEMAKAIPEESILEGDEEAKESPIITNIITGPTGDMEIKTKKIPEWVADINSCDKKCTCATMPSTDLHQLVTKYHLNQPPNSAQHSMPTQRVPIKPNIRKARPIRMSLVTKTNGVVRNTKNKNEVRDVPPNDADMTITMQGKEKTLKGVLTNLHSEFDTMNRRYEELSKLGESMTSDNIQELESLDKDLTLKEGEITMVMDLYKEVLALKDQIQTLKRKSSQISVNQTSKNSDYSNPKTAFHLTKLLKQIQLYQLHYKK